MSFSVTTKVVTTSDEPNILNVPPAIPGFKALLCLHNILLPSIMTKNCFFLAFSLSLASCLSGCTSYPRLLNFPFDAGGRSLNSPASELTPQVVSPYIAFISSRNGSQSVYLFDAQARRLIDLPGLNSLNEIASHPSVSEDGRYLVFAASRQGRTGIYLYDRETQQKRNLTENLAAEVRNPSISADGSTIVFEVAKDGQWDIAAYNRAGEALPIPGNLSVN